MQNFGKKRAGTLACLDVTSTKGWLRPSIFHALINLLLRNLPLSWSTEGLDRGVQDPGMQQIFIEARGTLPGPRADEDSFRGASY